MHIGTHVITKARATLFPLTILFFTNLSFAQIEEVIVTVQKRSENVQDVPISITALSGDFMEDSGVYDLQTLSQFVPNLTMSKSSQVANQRIIMRGVGTVGNNAIDPSVAIFIDGVYYPRAASIVGSLADIEMVEVLRGPQGTMFGRNASMGALNIRTQKPSDELEAWARSSYGDYNAVRVAGGVSGAITEQTAARLSFSHSNRDGYGDNTYTTTSNNSNNLKSVGDWEDSSVRASLDFSPSSNVNINLSLDWAEVKNGGTVIEVKTDTVLQSYITKLGMLTSDTLYNVAEIESSTTPLEAPRGAVPSTANTFDYTINQDHQDAANDEQFGFAGTIDWEVAEHTVRYILSYREWENTSTESALRLPVNLLNRDSNYDTDTFSHELQIISPVGNKLEYVGGFYYYDEDYKIDQDFNVGSNDDWCNTVVPNAVFMRGMAMAATLTTEMAIRYAAATQVWCNAEAKKLKQEGLAAVDGEFQQDVVSYAIFGQTTYNFSDQIRFTTGLRWTRDEKDGSFSQVVNDGIMSPSGLGIRIDDNPPPLKFSDSRLTWLINSSYDINDNIKAFATYSTGYKSGGFNSDGGNRAALPRKYDSETVDNIEVGVKSTLLDNQLVANLTWYHTEIKSFQDRQFDGVNFVVLNAGELTQQGIELDIRAQPIKQLYTVMGLSYLDSNFGSFTAASALPAAGTVIGQTATQDLTGSRNHFSPEWQFSLMGEWSDNLIENMSWFVRSEYQYIGKQNVGAETNRNPQSMQPGYDIVNARTGIRGQDARWELAGFVHNAFNEKYCQTIFNQPMSGTLGLIDSTAVSEGGGGGMQRCVLGAPRTFGVEATYRF